MASEWTVDTLKEHLELIIAEKQRAVDAAFAAQKSAIDAALAAADRAVQKAETAAEKRFESVNEFRAQLKDQQAGLMTRPEADSEFRAIREKIDGMVSRQDKGEGKGVGLQAGWIYLTGAVALLAVIIGLVFKFAGR